MIHPDSTGGHPDEFFLVLDLGGSWIKLAACCGSGPPRVLGRLPNPCRQEGIDGRGFAEFLGREILQRSGDRRPRGCVVATAGEVNASSAAYRHLAAHLGAMADPGWVGILAEQIGPPFFDLAIPLHSGPEAVAGSTRMKAGTATKRALNYLGTATMLLEGRACEGWMLHVDPNNEKLRRRALRILGQLSGASEPCCLAALESSHWRAADALRILQTRPTGQPATGPSNP